jgi:hypothetical protein
MKSPEDRKPLFERLKTGMEEAIRYNRGQFRLKTTVVEIPDPAPEIPPEESETDCQNEEPRDERRGALTCDERPPQRRASSRSTRTSH